MCVIFMYCGVEHAILSSHMQYAVMEQQLISLSNSMMNLPDVVQMVKEFFCPSLYGTECVITVALP